MEEEDIVLGERKKVKNVFEEMNLGLLIHVINNSLLYVLVFIIISGTIAFAYLRWTPDIYESNAVLMAKQSKQTELLGIGKLLKDDANEIKLEIGLMKSPFLIKRALDSIDIQLEYYSKGRFLETENYKTNPFYVEFQVNNSTIYDKSININFIDENTFEYSYRIKNDIFTELGTVGKELKNEYFSMRLFFKKNVIYSNLKNVKFVIKYRDINNLINQLISKIQIFPTLSGSKTIKIVYESENRTKSKDIVEAISKEFISYDKEKKGESVNSIIAFLDKQIDFYGEDFDVFQDSVKKIKMSTGFVDPSTKIETILTRIKDFEEKLLLNKYSNQNLLWLKEYLVSENNLALISPMLLGSSVTSFSGNIQRISKLEKEKELKLLDVTDEHPQIVILDNELANMRQNLIIQIEMVLDKNKKELERIIKEKNALYYDLYNNPDKETEYNRIINENNLRKNFLNNLINTRSSYMIAKAGILSDYIYLQKASTSKIPISPKRFFIKIIGILIGLFLGIGFIIIRYLTHNKIVSINEVTSNCNANMLGMIPKFNSDMEHSQIVVTQNPKASIAESFRSIRTNLEFLTKSKGSKLVVTTSTVPGEGKTFVGINMAAVFSLLNKKVIMVDFDLRKPRIAKVFNAENQRGTSTILIGKSTVQDCIQKSDIPNFDFLPSGPIPPNPAELISSDATMEMLEELKKEYDYVLLDTPPIGLVIDALSLLKQADYPLYVVRADYSKRQFLDNINKLIFENKITKLSTVLNDFGRGASGTAYKYGYSFGYGYGYGHGYGYGQGYYSDDVEIEKGLLFKIVNFFKK